MSVRLGEVAASAVLLSLAAAASVGAWRLGLGDVHNPGPGLIPLAAAVLLGLMALGQLVRVAAGGESDVAPRPFAQSRWGTVAIVLGSVGGFGALIDTLGFGLSTFLMLGVLFSTVARKRWWVALTAAAAIAVVARLAFRALGLQLPAGPLGL